MKRRVILTADDFGLDEAVNEAVERAHRDGVLTATSLMVGAPAAADAVARARRLPKLAVGLHVVLVQGSPVLPSHDVTPLVDATGAFPNSPTHAGLRYFFRPGARRALAAEIRAQFAAFAATGLGLDHVNAHNHLHLHPTILGLILRIGRDFGLRAMRLPYEPAAASAEAAGHGRAARSVASAALAPWLALLRRRLRRAGIMCNDFTFGLYDTGAMEEPLVLRQLAALPPGTGELYFHPAARSTPALARAMPTYRQVAELEALLSPRVRAALAAADLEPIAFRDL